MKEQALMAALALGATAAPIQGQAQVAPQHPTIVLVHGGFVAGSGWEGVFKRLRKNGYNVTVVQNPTTSLSDDVAATRRAGSPRAGQSDECTQNVSFHIYSLASSCFIRRNSDK